MENNSTHTQNTTVQYFSIARLAHQKNAEIEPAFVRRNLRLLNEFWNVKKTDTDYHKLKFNLDYKNPLILVQGWNKFKSFHDLLDNVEIVLIYRGNNVFEVDNIYDLSSDRCIPSYHSRSLHPTLTTFFDVDITIANYDAPKLRVETDFAHFLISNNLEYLVLCGDDGTKFTMKVLNSPDVNHIKLGREWDQFCNWQKLKIGDVIRFKFEIRRPNASTRCHVYKVCR